VIVIGKQEPSYPRPTATVVGDILTALVQALHSGDMDSHDAPARVPALFEVLSTAAFDFPVVRLIPDLRSLIACHASPVLVPPERHCFRRYGTTVVSSFQSFVSNLPPGPVHSGCGIDDWGPS
jgi:hypothetical protein